MMQDTEVPTTTDLLFLFFFLRVCGFFFFSNGRLGKRPLAKLKIPWSSWSLVGNFEQYNKVQSVTRFRKVTTLELSVSSVQEALSESYLAQRLAHSVKSADATLTYSYCWDCSQNGVNLGILQF